LDDHVLRSASERGHAKVVELLLTDWKGANK